MSESDEYPPDVQEKIEEWKKKNQTTQDDQKIDLDIKIKRQDEDVVRAVDAWNRVKREMIEKAKSLGITNVDTSDIRTYADLQDLAEKMNERLAEIELEGIKSSTEDKPPAGNVPLSGQQISGQKEYDSYEEMINDLYEKVFMGDREEAREAQAILDEFFKKWSRGMKHPSYRGFEYPSKQSSEPDEGFSVEKWRERQNERLRKKRLERRK